LIISYPEPGKKRASQGISHPTGHEDHRLHGRQEVAPYVPRKEIFSLVPVSRSLMEMSIKTG